MRVNYVLLAAAVVLVGAIDASVATADTVAKLDMESPAFAVENDNHRSLRLRKDDVIDSEEDESDDDSVEEERGFMDQVQLTKLAAKFMGKSSDEVGQVIKNLNDDKIELLFDKGGYLLTKHLPGFETGMSGRAFGNLIKDLPLEQQAPLLSAYSKYLAIKGLL
ncbi:hypothetical protein P3T76_008342 [Phytophthora citrophthora]|uniref:RxLR effector protein n=1 Tax=Phytophthora citrophthora TaxID=4793 RepID=A0AAD9GJY0_9STRA|nr:hypothetical protein P3T76_008338 [Phytophthora citrophthora]KAK1940019.1 hypothetical protein P3T76_008342 [Phytophthora citrophthora]